MPSTRIVIAANAKQNSKSIVLIPTSDDTDAFETIIDLAKKKLRLKGKRVFVGSSGSELLLGQRRTSDLSNDEIFLISSGEDYIGAPQASSLVGLTESDDPSLTLLSQLPPPTIHIVASQSYIDPAASKQLSTTASRLPGILAGIGMPDLHPGGTSGFPIGAVLVSHSSVIYPPLIGGDIGCGMALYKTGVSSPVKGQEGEAAARKLATKIRGIEGRYAPLADASDEASEGDNAHGWLAAGAVGQESLSNTVFAENNDSLGTIGGGNHFAELQAVDEIRDPALFAQYISQPTSESTAPVDTSRLFLLVHSGSRGVGQAILASTRSETQKGSLPLFSGTPDFENYMALHDDACRWARCNRDLIAHRILGCVDSSYAADCGEQIGTGSEGKHISAVVKDRKVLDIWHNNVEKRSWPTTSDTSETEDPATQQEAWLHRKGAAPSDKGLVVIPGSRGAHSYLVLPVGPQHANGFSLAHGAGRALTRSKALATAGSKYSSSNSSAGSSVSRLQTTSLHSTVICEEKELLFEEIPEAYKDIDAVVKDLEDSGIVKVVAVMRPVVTYKIRKEER